MTYYCLSVELCSVLIEHEFVIIVGSPFRNFFFATFMKTTQWAINIFGKTMGSFDVHENNRIYSLIQSMLCNDKTIVKFAKKERTAIYSV